MNRARFCRPLIALALVSALLIGINSPVAHAAWVQYQSSPLDTYNRLDLPVAYDITQVDFAVSDLDLNSYMFFLSFKKPITSRLFSDKHESFAGIFLDLDNDGKDDYSLETNPKIAYSGGKAHAGVFYKRGNGEAVVNTACAVKTWSNLGNKAAWIGFSIPKTCLPFAGTVSVSGYSDHIDGDQAEFDWAPNLQWKLNLAGDVISPTPNNPTPTNSASSSPSATPNSTPSATPNSTPSPTPSAKPSATPIATSSPTPSAKPSATPSAKPSVTPSAKPSPISTVSPTTSAAGTYGGRVTLPGVPPAFPNIGCDSESVYIYIYLRESQGGKIEADLGGSSTYSGTRVGSTISVTYLSQFYGQRGPFVWQWSGATLTGTLPYFCVLNGNGLVLGESTYNFILTRK